MKKKILNYSMGAVYMLLLAIIVCFVEKNPEEFLMGCTNGMSEQQMILWNMLFLPVWFFAFYQLNEEISLGLINILRYKSYREWYRKKQLTLMLFITTSYIIFAVSCFVLLGESDVIKSVLFILIQALFVMELGVYLIAKLGKIIPVSIIVIIVETVANKIIIWFRLKPAYIPFCWGMRGFADNNYMNGGFNIFIAWIIQIGVIVFVYMIGNVNLSDNKI